MQDFSPKFQNYFFGWNIISKFFCPKKIPKFDFQEVCQRFFFCFLQKDLNSSKLVFKGKYSFV